MVRLAPDYPFALCDSMEILSRHRNLIVLGLALCLQVLGLALQVKLPTERGPMRLIRVWGISLVTPAEHGLVHVQNWGHGLWRDYFYLRGVRRDNDRLQEEILRLRLEQVRLAQDAGQAQRLQALLRFKEQVVAETVAAQVIGTSGTDMSRIIYIDKGSDDGIRHDMAVIVPGGIVGKVIEPVKGGVSPVLKINDSLSGVGAMLEKSRSQGILKGTKDGAVVVSYIMSDEKVEPGETVVTSGGDGIFPKGLPIGRVTQVNPGPDAFLNIVVKPAASLNRLEEVLVITRVEDRSPQDVPEMPMRAADILAQRLPTIPVRPPDVAGATAAAAGTSPAAVGASQASPASGAATSGKPSGIAAQPAGTTKPAVTPGNKPAENKPKSATAGGQPAARSGTLAPATAGSGGSQVTARPPVQPKPVGAQPAAKPPESPKKENPQ